MAIITAHPGGAFLYMPVPFNKPATSIPEQIALLRQRGLVIQDNTAAEHCLKHIGYYRLAGYWQIFQHDPVNHIFIPGTSIQQIIALYKFDRELRLLLIDAIESIEVSFRAMLVNEMCARYGPTWYANAKWLSDL
jgi:abortive infection bacteriophage resistance protein